MNASKLTMLTNYFGDMSYFSRDKVYNMYSKSGRISLTDNYRYWLNTVLISFEFSSWIGNEFFKESYRN